MLTERSTKLTVGHEWLACGHAGPADMEMTPTSIVGRLVLDDAVLPGRIDVTGDAISLVEVDERYASGPLIAPGFVDVHVHGWGGHDAMGERAGLDGMARALLRRGVTSFLPTAVTAPFDDLVGFADRVRDWMGDFPQDGAEPLGFNLEGPFISPERAGAQNPAHILVPADVPVDALSPLIEGWRIVTIAPELPGALHMIGWLRAHGVLPSLGHSAATAAQAREGFAAGGATTTHLFNAMSAVDHREPGLAVTALVEEDVYVELIADGHHVHPDVWPLILRTKRPDRVLLVSDAIALAGTDGRRANVGGLDVEIRNDRCTLVSDGRLAGSVIALDDAVRNLVAAGGSLSFASAAATRHPLALLGVTDRGRLSAGQRADLVVLDDALRVSRVMRAGRWLF